ncbi:MAG: SBBP repeat-containing protein [Candidatus Odinarchaeota archaeon]
MRPYKTNLVKVSTIIVLMAIGIISCPSSQASDKNAVISASSVLELDDYFYSTYLGGTSVDVVRDIAVDSHNNFIVTGNTFSSDFPLLNAYQDHYAGQFTDDWHNAGGDAFVSKFDQAGQLLWSTYLGGSKDDGGMRIAVDDSDNIIVFGQTNSVDFPVSTDAYQSVHGGGMFDLFLTIFAPNGSVISSSYLGGSGDDSAGDLEMDHPSSIIITGTTSSSNFPVTADADQQDLKGQGDVFLTRLTANCSQILYSTFLGGSSFEATELLAIDPSGNIVIVGGTSSFDFPLTANAYQDSFFGSDRAEFIIKYNASDHVVFSTLFGGSSQDDCFGLDVDSQGNIIFSGRTWSLDFPVVNALQGEHDETNDNPDGFLTKLSADGSELIFSTFFGEEEWETMHYVAVDDADNVFVAGIVKSGFFESINGFQTTYQGALDIFVMVVSPTGEATFYSYLGGNADDLAFSLEMINNDLYITGITDSIDFIVTDNAFQKQHQGIKDGFIFKMNQSDYMEMIGENSSSSTSTSGFGVATSLLTLGLVITIKRWRRVRKKLD